jgi:DNA-directed RNA polymerase specialized sigma24 family protein
VEAEAVWAALGQLTDRQLRAVTLCLMQGLTLTQAAAEMGVCPTSVLRHRDRGVKRLRRLLSGL